LPGKLPETQEEITMKTNMLERVVGMKEDIKVDPIKVNDVLMLTAGTMRTIGTITSATPNGVNAKLRLPLCVERGERIALSRQVAGRWRLVGWAEAE